MLLVLWQAAAPRSARAQCLALADLLAIGAEPTALTAPQAVARYLPSPWVQTGPTAASREVFWALPPDGGTPLAAARLQVRAQRPGQDVVLKTTQGNCVRELRGELKSRKLTAQPVTCPNCEAVKYQAPDFEATIYSQMKGDYPFVVVVHQVLAAVAPAPATQGSGALGAGTQGADAQVSAPVRPVDVAAATQLLADPKTLVLDVRTPEEYAAGHLQRAQNLNFRSSDFGQQVSKLNPQGHYVLYCASGNRSGQAAALMQRQGIADVVNAGGYTALKAAGAK
ncbi:rhodanese-like domain-containing protein [Hymenobacter sp.]|uniref:rhodanese-like domain-containing protein n=1 Tax=Hymenobacter sp. TaxID=1898978 RepID=UPI00286CD562|nr:rhodanese-like domain-containing protein [Hymenobacter sp.]